MPGQKLLLVAALFVSCSQAKAVPVHVSIDWPGGMTASAPVHAHIEAVWTAGQANGNIPAAVEAESGPDGVVLDLSEGVWQVQASAPGYWNQGTQVAVAPGTPASVRLALWPAATLHGEIVMSEGETSPDALDVRLSAIAAPGDETTAQQASVARPAPNPSRADLHCRIEKNIWSCPGPAGLFDVQLEAAGSTPRYVWSMNLRAAATTDLGRTDLRNTPSVFGRAVRKDGSNPPGPCRATLQPDAERRSGPGSDPERAPAGEASASVPLSRSGSFQIVGVQPGRHVLSVECQGASGFHELIVQANGETRIGPPVPLEELTLDIAVTPKADPAGKPWQLTVDATAPRLRRIADNATTLADGRWTRHGLMAGVYRVAVRSSDGTLWPQQYFELNEGSRPVSLRLAFVQVAGRVLLGADPLRARLVFLNEAGGEPVTLSSDDGGNFQGLLPVEPGVQETSWTVDAHASDPPINRRLVDVNVPSVAIGTRARLELTVPTIAVHGSVVSQDNQPQRGIQVTLEDSSKVRTTVATDDTGSFEIPELPPGKYTAVTESGDGVSELTPLEVVDGAESELKLVLSPSRRVPFYVVSNDGPVSDAAVQVWIAPGVPKSFTHTDRDGRFEVRLPRGIAEVGLTIGAPGYAMKLTRIAVPSDSDPSPDKGKITLSASAGTLELDLKPPGATPEAAITPYLVHNGAVEYAGRLTTWGTDRPSGDGSGEVEAIEPGVYALCLVADPAQLTALWQGKLPPDKCHTDSVEQGRTLTLSPQ
jgi:hypothetical protein